MDEKLIYLVNEMKTQTALIHGVNSSLLDLKETNKEISMHTKSLAVTAAADSKAREKLYSDFTKGFLSIVKFFGAGLFFIMLMFCIAMFKLDFLAESGGHSVKIGSQSE
jgi:uncharacterized membrane protein